MDTSIKVSKVDDYQCSTECELRGPSDTVTSLQWHPSHADKLASISQQDKSVRCAGGAAGIGGRPAPL